MWYEDESNFPCWVVFGEIKSEAEYITHYESRETLANRSGLYNDGLWVADMEEIKSSRLLITATEFAEFFPERLV